MHKCLPFALWMMLLLVGGCGGSVSNLTHKAKASTTKTTPKDSITQQQSLSLSVEEFQKLLLGSKETIKDAPYRASAKRTHDLLHTQLDIRLDWKKRHLIGKATLTLQPYFYASNHLVLDAKGFDIHQVALVEGEKLLPLKHQYDGWKLNIYLDKAYHRTETYQVLIAYTAKPDELEEKNESISYDNKGLYFINPDGIDPHKPRQVWTQGETEAASCWFPTIDHPNERTTQEMAVTVANEFVTLSNGTLVSSIKHNDGTHTDYWKQELSHAPYLFALIVGEFAIIEDQWKDIPVNYYVEPKYESSAKAIFGNTPEMITFFSELLDYDFPWEKYAQIIVRDFTAGAMENTTAVIFYDNLNSNLRDLEDKSHEDIIAHELIHHWFGDLLTCESWSNLTLNEAFATYGEYLWFEHKYHQDMADHHLHNDLKYYLTEARSKQTPIVRYFYEHPDRLFDRHTYQKGGRVLHMLRKYVGDEAFFTALQVYIKQHAFDTVELDQLRHAFEKVTGEDLNWFFDQWFLEAGHPVLDIKEHYDKKTKEVTVEITQLQKQKGSQLFRLPIAIDIYLANGETERHFVIVEKEMSTFTFTANEKPLLINIDAEKMLLCEKQENKSVEQYMFQYQHAPLFLDRLEAVTALVEKQETTTAQQTLIQAVEDEFWWIRKIAIERINLTDSITAKTVIPVLKRLAQEDKRSIVRIAALNRLMEIEGQTYLPLLQKKLTDPSYLVVSTALSYLYRFAPQQATVAAIGLENEDNMGIIHTIARIYAHHGSKDKQYFFEEKLKTATKGHFSLIDYYGQFLKRIGSPTLETGIATLQQIAVNSKVSWIRLNATRTIEDILEDYNNKKTILEASLNNNSEGINPEGSNLQLMKNQIKNISNTIQNIKNQEKDEQLLDYYKN